LQAIGRKHNSGLIGILKRLAMLAANIIHLNIYKGHKMAKFNIRAQAKQYRASFASINADCLFGFYLNGQWHEPCMDEFLSFSHEDALEAYAEQYNNLSGEIHNWGNCLIMAKLILNMPL
jgi:hypothetical protein